MFIVNQAYINSINADCIEQIIAVNARVTDKLPPEANVRQKPLVVALVNGHEEVLGEYNSFDDCRAVIDYISYLINKNAPVIRAPKLSEVATLRKNVAQAEAEKLNKSINNLEKVLGIKIDIPQQAEQKEVTPDD